MYMDVDETMQRAGLQHTELRSAEKTRMYLQQHSLQRLHSAFFVERAACKCIMQQFVAPDCDRIQRSNRATLEYRWGYMTVVVACSFTMLCSRKGIPCYLIHRRPTHSSKVHQSQSGNKSCWVRQNGFSVPTRLLQSTQSRTLVLQAKVLQTQAGSADLACQDAVSGTPCSISCLLIFWVFRI